MLRKVIVSIILVLIFVAWWDKDFDYADQSGRIVVHQNERHQPAGQHSLSLSTRDMRPGVYYYTLIVGDFSKTRSLVIK